MSLYIYIYIYLFTRIYFIEFIPICLLSFKFIYLYIDYAIYDVLPSFRPLRKLQCKPPCQKGLPRRPHPRRGGPSLTQGQQECAGSATGRRTVDDINPMQEFPKIRAPNMDAKSWDPSNKDRNMLEIPHDPTSAILP